MDGTRIEYVGHATVLLAMDGVRLLTDPLLRRRVAHLRRVTGVDADALQGIDMVLISHLHYDHLDLPSLRRLGDAATIVCPRGAGELLRRKCGSGRQVLELGAGEETRVGDVVVQATHAEHDAGRLPWGTRAEPVGYVIRGGSRSVYFAGDTDLFEDMTELGPLDVALLPIWGWGPSLGPGHMNPERAAAALALLRPTLAIPIHWGTYFPMHLGIRGIPAFVGLAPAEFVLHAHELAPEVEVRVLQPGEATTV